MDIFPRRSRFFAAVLGAAAWTVAVAAAGPTPDPGEQRWINAIRVRKTGDGRTVADVLASVEKRSHGRFKVKGFDVFYDQKGRPVEVAVLYWIGSKRAPDLVFADLAYPLGADGVLGKVVQEDHTTLAALEKGVESFSAEIERRYRSDCPVDPNMRSENC